MTGCTVNVTSQESQLYLDIYFTVLCAVFEYIMNYNPNLRNQIDEKNLKPRILKLSVWMSSTSSWWIGSTPVPPVVLVNGM